LNNGSECPSHNTNVNPAKYRLMPVIPALQEAEIRRIDIQGQPRQIVHETLSRKKPSQKRIGGVV
jgi:hypothetical protein